MPVLWCSGCGQPHAALGTSGLIPLPTTYDTKPPQDYPHYRAGHVDRGNLMERPGHTRCGAPDPTPSSAAPFASRRC